MKRQIAELCVLLSMAVLAVTAGCGSNDEAAKAGKAGKTASSADGRPNIILVLVDALRKDHLGCYGYGRNTTPFIDSMAEDGLIFENNVAQATYTHASMSSMFTSRYISNIFRDAKDPDKYHAESALPDEAVTIADALAANGYITLCATNNPYVSEKYNMLKGFAVKKYEYDAPAGLQEFIAEELIKDASGKGESFFLYMHLMDVHSPTNPPPEYAEMFTTKGAGPRDASHRDWAFEDGNGLDTPEFRSFRANKVALYDGSVRYVDSELARLAEYLKRAGLYDNTVIVVTADHGEELWDHARFEVDHLKAKMKRVGTSHGHTFFREILDVPLVVYGKGVPKGRINRQTRNIDIAPTILGLAGVDSAKLGMEGVDLVGSLKSGSLPELPALTEMVGSRMLGYALQDARYKFIDHYGVEMLFDKSGDPGETVDVSKEHPAELVRLKDSAASFRRGALASDSKEVEIDDDTKKQLKALGYVQ